MAKKAKPKKTIGIEINPDALKIAKSRYPETEFIEANILETPMKKYDYIFC